LRERQFTTENTPGLAQQVIPSFITQMATGGEVLRQVDFYQGSEYPEGLVHGEQAITLSRPIPPSGTAHVRQRLVGVFDKGSGALALFENDIALADTGEHLGTSRMGVFAIGWGGFGGPRSPPDEPEWSLPQREPDIVVPLPVGLNQSLIFRILGDRNLHATDPGRAATDGFERPAFFGLGSYGVICRALLRGLCDEDVAKFGGMAGRFSKPVYPGDQLQTRIWRNDHGGAQFTVVANGERLVFDRGRFQFRA
jgi:acyl dehydratase